MNTSVLHRPSGSPALPRGRLVFSIDATASRQRAWHIARDLQAHMFIEAGSVGMLNLQLVYFQGTVCRASRWASRGEELARWMSTIKCETGVTQIERVLRHAPDYFASRADVCGDPLVRCRPRQRHTRLAPGRGKATACWAMLEDQ